MVFDNFDIRNTIIFFCSLWKLTKFVDHIINVFTGEGNILPYVVVGSWMFFLFLTLLSFMN